MSVRLRPMVWTLWSCGLLVAQTTKTPRFAQDIAPILSEKCMQCHGLADPMANLDLKSRAGALKGGQHGPAIIPGNAAGSNLYRHATGQEQPRMPLGGKLSDEEIAVLKAWIDSGAEWDANVVLRPVSAPAARKQFTDAQRKFWAFQRIVKADVPTVKGKSWV